MLDLVAQSSKKQSVIGIRNVVNSIELTNNILDLAVERERPNLLLSPIQPKNIKINSTIF